LNIVAHEVDAKAKRIMATQLAATAVMTAVFGLVGGGSWSALSALCGGLASLCIVLLLRRGVRRASEVALTDQKKSMMILYLGAAQRFVAIIAFFALGLGVFGLAPLAMFAGFAVAQASNFAGVRT
jgi:F0F1-type ATP synthase assembly protein I